jgi:hypothetical protein
MIQTVHDPKVLEKRYPAGQEAWLPFNCTLIVV